MAFKKERLEKIIEREVGMLLLSEVKDERLKLVTITKVSLTNDLSIATIYYRVLGDQAQIDETTDSLNDAKGFIRSSLAKKLEVRKTPELRFKFDTSFEEGNKIERILQELNK